MYTISFCFCKVFVTQWEIPSVSYGKSCVFCFVCVRPRPRFFCCFAFAALDETQIWLGDLRDRLLFSPFSFSGGVLICHCLLQLERHFFCPSSLSFRQVDQHAVACSWLIKAISNYVHSGGKSKPRIRCRRRTRYTVQ